MSLPTAFAIAAGTCAAGLVLLLWAEHLERAPLRWWSKPVASLAFIAAGAAIGVDDGYALMVLAGLVLGAAGDVLLIPASRRAFLAGLATFLAGHIVYAVAFARLGLDATWALAGAGAGAFAGAVVLRWLWPHLARPMRGPVVVYVVAIAAMGAAAAGAAGAGASWHVPVGALLFLASDVAVARHRFVQPAFVNRAWGLPAYYAGQLLIAASIGFNGS